MADVNLYSQKVHSRRVFPQNNWIEGLSDYNKEGGSYLWARGVDYRTEPSQLTLLPQAILEAGASVFTDLPKWAEQVVGRTITLGSNTNLISNSSFETNTTGWTLGADYTRTNDDAYLGSYSIKQVSVGGSATLTTASGSGIATTAYADYQLVFYAKVAVSSGQAPQLQVLGGSLSGPSLLASPQLLSDTASAWQPITVSFNAGQYTSVFIVITNQTGTITAHYDNFSLQQINSLATFGYGNLGNLYKRYSNGTWVTLGSIANSHGNGMAYYGEDDYLYIMGDKTVGRYGPISSGTPMLVADYLTAAGGVPTNTNSASLIAANSDYFVKTSPAAALKITSDIALEAFIKPTSLPAVGSSMTIAGMWNENTNKRAYKLDLLGVSGYFGDGSDGSLTISVNTTDAPIDSACSGTIGTNQLNANNVSFAAGQIIFVWQVQGTGAGTWQRTKIQGYDSTNHIITTQDALTISYNSSGSNKAQVIVVKQYTNVTVNTGVTWTPKAWNGTTGGILLFLASGTVSIVGSITASGKGFRGGASVVGEGSTGYQGEGTLGTGTQLSTANTNGGGGAFKVLGSDNAGGGGGGNGAVGSSGANKSSSTGGSGGSTVGTVDLTTMELGGGGGGSAGNGGSPDGQPGGGALFITAQTLTITGALFANGTAAQNGASQGSGGAGAGGSILLKAQTATLGTSLIVASGGAADGTAGGGGAGGTGRVVLDYYTGYTGTTSPTINAIQDNTLVTTTTYQARLGISNDGTAFEYLTQNLQSLAINQWDRVQVSWQASLSTASFYENGVLIGTSTGTKTAIYGLSTADFTVGANVGASVYQNFFDGLINDVRVWTGTRSQAQFSANNLFNLQGVAAGLVGNWFLTNTGNDLTANADNLVATGTPTPGYSTDVPYFGATTRGDIDQTGGGTANTYTVPTSLTEADKLSFVPAYDPQKSIQLNIGATGAGNWTVVIHDGLNNQVALITVANASLHTGQYEFVFPQIYRPVVGATYHMHVYSSAGSGTIKTTTASDITTAQFTTYYQFLVSDTEYHPAMQIGNSLAIGNERYLALLSASGGDTVGVYNGQGFNSRRLRFPSGWRVRCMARWGEYYAIGCWKGTSIKDFDQGIVFLWDGYSITYNTFFDVPEGGVNAMYGENDTLYLVAGYKGDLLEYTGGRSAKKVKRLPRLGNAKYMEVSPGAMTFYGALLRIGVSYNSDSTTLERGVYTWGTLNEKYPKSLSYDYPVSTGNRGSTVSIGALVPVGGSLLMFYKDGTASGVNNINAANAPQTSGTLEGLVSDFGFVWHDKDLQIVRADHLPLTAGANVDVKYKLNYESTWHNLGISSQVVGDQSTRLPIANASTPSDYHIMQIGIDLTATQGAAPTILEHSQLTDFLLGEADENATY